MVDNPSTSVKVTDPPTVFPVTLAEMKAHLAVTFDDDDILIGDIIAAATDHVQKLTGRLLIDQSGTAYFTSFGSKLVLPVAPVTAVSAVRYVDRTGTLRTLSPSAYRVSGLSRERRPAIIPAAGTYFPSVDIIEEAVEVDFDAGYGATGAAVPPAIRQAIRLLGAHFYENREGSYAGQYPMIATVMGVADLIQDYREWAF